MSNIMENDVYNAAVNGDLTIFSNKNHEHLLKKTYQNNNIIHLASQHKQIHFIKAALNSFPSTPTCESLICDQNRHGNTSLHIAAQVGQEAIIDILYEFFSTQCTKGGGGVFPWRIVNSEGNTPAHVALLYGNVSVARYLVEKDGSLARVTNDSKETLLHLAIRYHEYDNLETEATSSIKKVYQPIEDLWPIIELLLRIDSSVACWVNTDGLTPLHLAASLNPAYCIRVIKAMLGSCPQAAEVHDERSEQTILHLLTNHHVASYEQGIELLQIPQVYALIDIKDDQGDTPLHLAARNRDTIMVRVLLEYSAKLGLKNKSGVSARSLLRQLEEMRITETPVENKRKLTKEECEAAIKGNVVFLSEQLAALGMNFLEGGNILHVLMQYIFHPNDYIDEAEKFIGETIQMLPSLISQQDRNGNTLIHLIAESEFWSSKTLNIVCKYFNNVREEAGYDARDGLHLLPWKLKNVKGDMPLHVAIRARNYESALKLLELDGEVADYVHNRNQNPLHLISYHNGDHFYDGLDRLIDCLVNVNAELPYMQDDDGLTPLLVAVQQRSTLMFRKLCELFPKCKKIADFKGRKIWHLFACQRAEYHTGSSIGYCLLREKYNFLIPLDDNDSDGLRSLMISKDDDGNTPLHLAIANQQFTFAQFFLNNWILDMDELPKYAIILSDKNNEGVSCLNLIGAAEHLPRQLEISLFKNGNLLSGHRSIYGVPTTKIEAYANTIGVVAALLATITFTAAFTVPGGLDSSNGTPLLLQRATFQVFMVADVVAMCSSMMVLFCLLWIMTTCNKADSILLLDVSVFLLQTSLHATIVTFMTGLYVTTISNVPAIAISTCVACILLIILMHKRLVMLTVVPFFEMWIILVEKVGRTASNQLSSLWSAIKKLIRSSLDKYDDWLRDRS